MSVLTLLLRAPPSLAPLLLSHSQPTSGYSLALLGLTGPYPYSAPAAPPRSSAQKSVWKSAYGCSDSVEKNGLGSYDGSSGGGGEGECGKVSGDSASGYVGGRTGMSPGGEGGYVDGGK